MTSLRLHFRRAGAPADAWETVDLPPASSVGIAGGSWDGASVSAALVWLQRHHDASLGFSLSCRRGLCDVCALRIDGTVATACTTPLRDGMRLEPAKDALARAGTIIDLSLVRRARFDPTSS